VVWEYQIGGYQVLDKWLKDRAGRPYSVCRSVAEKYKDAANDRCGDIAMSRIYIIYKNKT
jgi:hypothetical protein